MHLCSGIDLAGPARSRPAGRVRAVAGCVENDDSELTAVQRRAGATGQRVIQRVGVVRYQHDGELSVLTPGIVGEASAGAYPLGPSTFSAVSTSVRTLASR